MRYYYTAFISMFVLFFLGGCTAKSNFYRLDTYQTQTDIQHMSTQKKVIGVAEVVLPKYIDKPEIVIQLSKNRYAVNDDDRWAGSFDKNIQILLTKNLSAALPKYMWLSYPWVEPLQDTYRLYLIIDRFDGNNKGTVFMEGHWSLIDMHENRLVAGAHIALKQQGSATVEGVVETQSRMLQKLGQDIARKIRHAI